MPVVDWTRTDLEFKYFDGSNALKFDFDAFSVFDIFLMKRENAKKSYSTDQIERAQKVYQKMTDKEKEKLIDTIIKGLPGLFSQSVFFDRELVYLMNISKTLGRPI